MLKQKDLNLKLSPNREVCIENPGIKELYNKYDVKYPQDLMYELFGHPGGDIDRIFIPKTDDCKKECCKIQKHITTGHNCETNKDCCSDEECKRTSPVGPGVPEIRICMKKTPEIKCVGKLVENCESHPISSGAPCDDQYIIDPNDKTNHYQCNHNDLFCLANYTPCII